MTEPQRDRFLRAYEIARAVMRELGWFPRRGPEVANDEKEALAWDEFDTGYPRITLSLLLDVVGACAHTASKGEGEFDYFTHVLKQNPLPVRCRVEALKPDHPVSWRTLHGKPWRLQRLKVFEHATIRPLDPHQLTEPGRVSIIDLSDSESPQLNNLTIASMLRNIQRAQEARYDAAVRTGVPPRTLVIIEEAHEFLSTDWVERMPVLFEQVERIAKRGRKRWLGLCFVTQLPQHLPPQLLGLVNNFVIHKITDPNVVQRLQRTIPGIDPSLWLRLPGLAPGQAIVSLASMTRPLLVSMDPAPCALRMAD